jgi:hypothetical protein
MRSVTSISWWSNIHANIHTYIHTYISSIDMYNNDVGQESALNL